MTILTLTLGLILLLWGMKPLRHGLQAFAGARFRGALNWMTSTPWHSFWSGIAATAMLQSSTAMTVMSVSFVDAGLIPFENALGLILGSNIGTTVTTQLLAFPLERFTPYLLLLSALGFLFVKSRLRYLCQAVFGLGLLFFALQLLKAEMAPLAEHEMIQNFLHHVGDHYLQGVLAGTLLSAFLHSSTATTGIVMLLTEDGWLTMPTALAFIFGANIGTCFTAVIASLAASRAAQRVALFHVILNLCGALLFLPVVGLLAAGLENLGGSLSRQVANAHTFFNLISSLLAFPLLPMTARFLRKLLP